MTAVSCSDGANGLITKYGWQTQGAIPNYPYIGGYQGIAGWNSPQACSLALLLFSRANYALQCGTCYSVTYNANTIYVLAIDHTATGFNLAKQAMDALTNNQAEMLGRVDAQYVQVDNSKCKI